MNIKLMAYINPFRWQSLAFHLELQKNENMWELSQGVGGWVPLFPNIVLFFTKNSELFVKTKIELQNIPQILLVYRVLPNPEGGGSAKLKLNSREIPPQLNQPSVF